MASMAQLKNHPRVEEVSDERAFGNGIIVYLKKGFSTDPQNDTRVFGEDTISAAMHSVRHYAQPYAGPFED